MKNKRTGLKFKFNYALTLERLINYKSRRLVKKIKQSENILHETLIRDQQILDYLINKSLIYNKRYF